MPGIPSKDASFVRGTPRNYALTLYKLREPESNYIDSGSHSLILFYSCTNWQAGFLKKSTFGSKNFNSWCCGLSTNVVNGSKI